jgi:hypothetical protein
MVGVNVMALASFSIIFLIGAALGLRFKVLILLPAIGLATLATAAVGNAHGDRVATVMVAIVLVAAALQIGYLFGIVARATIRFALKQSLVSGDGARIGTAKS